MSALIRCLSAGSVLCLCILLGAGAGAAPAAGQPRAAPEEQRKAEARVHLQRGAELVEAEDLQGALSEFEAAYRLVPSPSILHNFGVVLQGLGRKAAALDAFQRFLDQAPDPPPEVREHARRAVERLRGEVGELRVDADVAGATIFIDGREVGRTPQEKPIHVDAGPHHLSVEKSGLGTVHTARLEVRAGERLTVPARLAPPPPATPPAPAVSAELARSPPLAPARTWQRPTAWTVAAAAGLAAGVSATAIAVRYVKFTDFNDRNCGTQELDKQPRRCQVLYQSGKDAERWATVSGAVAGALGVGAALLFVTLPESRLRVSVQSSPADLGLRLQGRF